MVVGNQAYQKAVNTALVMRSIRDRPGVSRTEIAAVTGLTKSTISNLVRELRSQRLIEEVAHDVPAPRKPGGTAAGRPPIGLVLSAQSVHAMGVELRSDGVSIVTVTLDGTVVSRVRRANPAGRMPLTEAWETAVELLSQSAARGIVGLGVAVPATTDPYRGVVVESEDFNVRDFSLQDATLHGKPRPVLLENDANAVAWGGLSVARETAPSGPVNLLVVTGRFFPAEGVLRVGTGIVLNSRVYYGRDFGGGEFRSVRWRHRLPGELETAMNTPEGPRGTVRELLESLSVPISMLRPQHIVVAGDLIGFMALIEDVLQRELAGAYVDPRVSGAAFHAAPEQGYAVAAGAASMFLEHLFEIPSVDRSRPVGTPNWHDVTG